MVLALALVVVASRSRAALYLKISLGQTTSVLPCCGLFLATHSLAPLRLKVCAACKDCSANRSTVNETEVTHCVVGSWTDWGTCTKTCGGGFQRQFRKVLTSPQNGGSRCPALYRTASCGTAKCPHLDNSTIESVDCVVSDWSALEPCSKSCGGGVRQQYRQIEVKPAGDGARCPSLYRQFSCNLSPCDDAIETPAPLPSIETGKPCLSIPVVSGIELNQCASLPSGQPCQFTQPKGDIQCYIMCKDGHWSKPTCGQDHVIADEVLRQQASHLERREQHLDKQQLKILRAEAMVAADLDHAHRDHHHSSNALSAGAVIGKPLAT